MKAILCVIGSGWYFKESQESEDRTRRGEVAGGWVRAGKSQIACFSKKKKKKASLKVGVCAHLAEQVSLALGPLQTPTLFCSVLLAFKSLLRSSNA